MIRNLKALGLSLVAMFALGAIGASTASAVDVLTVGSPDDKALVTGVGHNHKFTAGNSSYQCTTSKFAATVEDGASITTVDVDYKGTLGGPEPHEHCNASPSGTVKVDMEGCHYDLTGNTTATHGGGTDATVWITCPETKKIKITSSLGPVISIGAQTPTQGGVTYTNVSHEGTHGVAVKATVTGVTYSCAPTFTCTLGGQAHHGNNSVYTGDVTMTAYEDRNGPDEEGKITPATEGSKVDLTWSGV